MKARMMMFASVALFLGVMLGSASAQNNVTCTASGNLALTGQLNTIYCVGASGTLWAITVYNSSELIVEYVPNHENQKIAIAQDSLTQVCFSDVSACALITQGTISNNLLPITMTGDSE